MVILSFSSVRAVPVECPFFAGFRCGRRLLFVFPAVLLHSNYRSVALPFGLFAFGNSHDGGYRIACAEVDDLHPLGSPSGQPDVGGSGTYRRSVAGDYHQVVFVGYRLDGDHLAGLLGHLHRLDALAAPVGRAVGIQIGAFAVTVLAEYEDVVGAFRFHAYHSYYAVVAFDGDGAYACSRAAYRAYLLLREPDGLAFAGGDNDVGAAAGQVGVDELVALLDGDGIDTVLAGPGVSLQFRLLDDAFARAHDDVVVLDILLVVEPAHVDVSTYLVVRFYLDDVLYGASLRGARSLPECCRP